MSPRRGHRQRPRAVQGMECAAWELLLREARDGSLRGDLPLPGPAPRLARQGLLRQRPVLRRLRSKPRSSVSVTSTCFGTSRSRADRSPRAGSPSTTLRRHHPGRGLCRRRHGTARRGVRPSGLRAVRAERAGAPPLSQHLPSRARDGAARADQGLASPSTTQPRILISH